MKYFGKQFSNMRLIILALFYFVFLLQCKAQLNEVHPSWVTFFDSYSVKGSCVIWGEQLDKYHFYNRAAFTIPQVPAGTFDMMQVLAAMQSKLTTDTNDVLHWDGVKRSQDVWNRDNTLAEAFRNNNGAALEQLTKNITSKKWKKYLRKSDYGNKLCSDTLAPFWANGTLLITPAEQIFFLKKLFKNQLPFKNKYCNLVKELMLLECKPGYKMYGKSGMYQSIDKNFGWFVGFVQSPKGVYYFATTIESGMPAPEMFSISRVAITRKALDSLGFIELK